MTDEDTPKKRCNACEEEFPATKKYFYANIAQKDNLLPRCKKCHKERRQPRPVIPEGQKRCPRCTGIFLATYENFGKCEARKDHLNVYCKECQQAINIEKYAQAKEQGPKEPLPDFLVCDTCGRSRPATPRYFPKNPRCRYGLVDRCWECENKNRKHYLQKNRTKRRVWVRLHYRLHRVSYFQQRYQEKKYQILARQHQFKLAFPEIVRGWKRKYSQSPRGRLRQIVNVQKRRSRLQAAEGTFNEQDITTQFKHQKRKCYYCDKRMKKYHIEHVVPISRGGRNDMSNIVLSYPECNWKKHNKLPHEWPEGNHLM